MLQAPSVKPPCQADCALDCCDPTFHDISVWQEDPYMLAVDTESEEDLFGIYSGRSYSGIEIKALVHGWAEKLVADSGGCDADIVALLDLLYAKKNGIIIAPPINKPKEPVQDPIAEEKKKMAELVKGLYDDKTTILDAFKKRMEYLDQQVDEAKQKIKKGDEAEQKIKTATQEFIEWKENEEAKLANEKEDLQKAMREFEKTKSNFEKQRLALEVLPTRRERQEADMLRNQIASLHKEKADAEKRHQLAQERQKQRMDSVLARNLELEDQVSTFERSRLEQSARQAPTPETPEGTPRPSAATARRLLGPQAQTYKQAPAAARRSPPAPAAKAATPVVKSTIRKPQFTPKVTPRAGQDSLMENSPAARPALPSSNMANEGRPTPQAISKTKARSPISLRPKRSAGSLKLDAFAKQLLLPPRFTEINEDGKITRTYQTLDVISLSYYPNGVFKVLHADGSKTIYLANQDIKRELPDGSTVYEFADRKTVETTYKDGLKMIMYSNGQAETRYLDGSREIQYPDGTMKFISSSGEVSNPRVPFEKPLRI
ncbi:T-complex protein 10 C-terminus-domain-containing protein [Powellomyces hirtus]|nr:T-complex protein 10 C-terminus-domain-containing protein [Powellomyces hirtus]